MEVIGREAGDAGQPLEIERRVEMRADVSDDALEAAAVVEDGERLGHDFLLTATLCEAA